MDVSSNRLQDVKTYYLAQLNGIYTQSEANSLLNKLLMHFLKLPMYQLISDNDFRLSESELLKIHFAVKDLLLKKPLQYILGTVEFCENQFKVDQRALIPRPETEELCRHFFRVMRDYSHNKLKVLDIGTGTGCLAISIKKKFPNFEVYAMDKSEEAIQLSLENAGENQTEVHWIIVDFLNLKDQDSLPVYDVIISNPPYIPFGHSDIMDENVTKYEPGMALFVPDNDPLCFYKEIRRFCNKGLKEGGHVFLETSEYHHHEVRALFELNAFDIFDITLDFRGKERFVVVRKKQSLQ